MNELDKSMYDALRFLANKTRAKIKTMEDEQQDILWEAPEYIYREKTMRWYWANIAVATVLIAIAIWQHNFLFGFFIFVAEILLLAWSQREPEKIWLTDENKTWAVFIE